MEEIALCEPVCSNHHRMRERQRFKERKARTGSPIHPGQSHPEYEMQRKTNRRNRRYEQGRAREVAEKRGERGEHYTFTGPNPTEEE